MFEALFRLVGTYPRARGGGEGGKERDCLFRLCLGRGVGGVGSLEVSDEADK